MEISRIKLYEEIISIEKQHILDIEKAISDLDKIIRELFSLLSNQETDRDIFALSLNKLKAAVEKSLKINSKIWNKQAQDDEKHTVLYEKLKLFGRNQYHSMIDSMNALSIVCHDPKGKFVFLGDATSEVIENIAGSFLNNYCVVKIQHHATDNYFTEAMPLGNNFIISNGGYKRRKVSRRIINKINSYPVTAGVTKIYCTNAHENAESYCEYYATHNRCSDLCVKMNREREIRC